MKKFSLDIQPDYEFEAIGIVCHAPDYKLCYNINLAFNWQLANLNNTIDVDTPSEEIVKFSYFEFVLDDDCPVLLYNNKSENRCLLPSNKDADYILVLHKCSDDLVTETLKNLRKVKTILFTYKLDLDKVSNKSILLLN